MADFEHPRTAACSRRRLLEGLGGAAAAGLLRPVPASCLPAGRLGVNFKRTPSEPLDGQAARRSLRRLASDGAGCVAFIPFLWQAAPTASRLVRGNDLSDGELLAGVTAARREGLDVIIKPHVWIPSAWAGMIEPDDRTEWLSCYEREMLALAALAEKAQARALVVATEIRTLDHSAWLAGLAQDIRRIYSGPLVYCLHSIEDAETFPHWRAFDVIGINLYPELGPSAEDQAMVERMDKVVARLDAVIAKMARTVWITELGLMSARGAQAKPWLSPEELPAPPDPAIQQRVLSLWLDRLLPRPIERVLFWCWYSDPDAGGPNDRDFTIQNKPAERLLARG
ncbi:glycoside hydrolase family 113 [Telmatospirillum siberiense]|uniref:Glycosidase-like protein n=1 Tax=Telmatospirillum siberiense TaxID=382514 RepID=A0A2N3PVK2_9PROT|nr:glycosidase-like protein [Telmatospirillum siberiense]PKU24420.1 glycosidase-like protein [Telmatospirillum siberiense]